MILDLSVDACLGIVGCLASSRSLQLQQFTQLRKCFVTHLPMPAISGRRLDVERIVLRTLQDMNLRELTNKYGRGVGLNVSAVGVYTAQLMVALRHMKRRSVLHADIKPDNILVNARRSKVKICDFGSAMLNGNNERTPYLVSRFYRPPEVILGNAYGT